MTNLHYKLQALFPDADPQDWVVGIDVNTGDQYIMEWNRPGNPPNQAALDAVSDTAANNANKNARFKRQLGLTKAQRALVEWIADKHSLTYQQAEDEIRVIWDSL